MEGEIIQTTVNNYFDFMENYVIICIILKNSVPIIANSSKGGDAKPWV